MTKRFISIAVVVGLLTTAGLASAEQNRFGVEWDAEAVSKMSREDRLAYQKQYKAALEEAARVAGAIPAEPKAAKPSGRVATPSLVPGTSITYHSGTLSPAVQDSFMVGNRFDDAITTMGAIGPVEMSGSITMATIDMVAVDGASAFFSVYDQINGTTANQVTSMNTPLVAGLNTITLPTALNYVGDSFLAGVWNFTAAGDTVNVATGTVGGQGFHGAAINDGMTGMSLVDLTMTNGAVGVGGNVATPVELLSFQID